MDTIFYSFLDPCTLQCNSTATPIMKQSLLHTPWNLAWFCDLLWPKEHSRTDSTTVSRHLVCSFSAIRSQDWPVEVPSHGREPSFPSRGYLRPNFSPSATLDQHNYLPDPHNWLQLHRQTWLSCGASEQ